MARLISGELTGHSSTGKQFVRAEFVITKRKLRSGSDLKPGTVSVFPRRRRMNRHACFQLKLGSSPQIFLQDSNLDLQLMFVAGVLVVAAAATKKIGTDWLYSMRRSLPNRVRAASRKTALLFEQRSFDSFAFQHKGYEHSFAGTVLIGRQPGKTVAAINEFFNGELQAKILCRKPKRRVKRIADITLHIEQAQSRQSIFFQQSLVEVLLEQLLDLR